MARERAKGYFKLGPFKKVIQRIPKVIQWITFPLDAFWRPPSV